ncbi:hypothetical protein [Yoonia litorea]|uniref:Uncharacterized protein n=1 Tax=Yoonia litorea TaxID=1123755 RepID=A0A1I6LD10_9RHOB|nr:hypothetical protein [Yoonia litorea]SFS01356.1 hypothetical protein SAMN05444714_0408 [Yoonia litorea]
MSNRQVLLLIAAFVALTLGSFIWYIATWDADERVGHTSGHAPIFILAQKLPPEASAFSTGANA